MAFGARAVIVGVLVTAAAGGAGLSIVSGSGGSGACAQTTANIPDGPDPWGGCFPGTANTGVPSGTSMTTMTVAQANTAMLTTNAVIDSKTITGTDCVEPVAAGVTIKNSTLACVRISSSDPAGNIANTRFKIMDSNLDCGGIPTGGSLTGQGVYGQNFDILRTEIVRCSDGAYADFNASMTDSFVHNMAWNAAPEGIHVDGFQGVGGTNVSLTHNTVIVYDYTDANCTYAVLGDSNAASATGRARSPATTPSGSPRSATGMSRTTWSAAGKSRSTARSRPRRTRRSSTTGSCPGSVPLSAGRSARLRTAVTTGTARRSMRCGRITCGRTARPLAQRSLRPSAFVARALRCVAGGCDAGSPNAPPIG
jgi:hypothetical protein